MNDNKVSKERGIHSANTSVQTAHRNFPNIATVKYMDDCVLRILFDQWHNEIREMSRVYIVINLKV